MNRPCTCDAVQLGTRWSPGQCRACWLFHHSLNKRLEWGGDGHVQTIPPLSTEEWENMQPQYRPALHCAWEKWQKHGKRHPQPRVGTQLKQLISWFNIKPEKGCQCESRAAAMDALGPGWCRENKKTILDWLELEATKRSLPFSRLIGEQFINLAIHNAVEEFKHSPHHYVGYFGDWTSPEEYAKSFLDNGCPLWPHTFNHFPNTQEGFRLAFTEACNRVPVMPQWQYEKGIAICGGGRKYFPGAYATIRIIREHGCDWPIELWHLGPQEREPEMDALLSKCGDVRWRDGLEVAANVGLRCAGGWELKAFALAYSDFEKVLLLDADCYPVHHPQETIDQAGETGAIFWPDCPDFQQHQYDFFGVPRQPDPFTLESGQLFVNKRLHWKPTWLSVWMNHNSVYVYKHIYGDKDTFLLSWLKAGHEFILPERRPDTAHGAFLHKDTKGRVAFVHRCQNKPVFDAWTDRRFPTRQIGCDTTSLPLNDSVNRALATGNVYLDLQLSNHERYLELTLPTGKLALDIGANKGIWSSELCRRFDHTIAFDPDPSVADVVGYLPNMELRQVAVSDVPGVVTMHLGDRSENSTLLSPPPSTTPPQGFTERIVEAVTIDSLNLAPDFLKIDVEGAEDKVLRGAEQTIRQHRPAMVVECHGRDKHDACLGMLTDWGFDPIFIDNPVTPVGATWLWTPRERLPDARLTIVRGAIGEEHNAYMQVGEADWQRYAKERGYNYLTFNQNWTTRPAAWNKLLWLLSVLKRTSGDVLWADADTLLSDPSQDLHDMIPAQGVAMSWHTAPDHFNSGVMAIRNDWVSREYLQGAWDIGPTDETPWWFEQTALNTLAKQYGTLVLDDHWHGTFGPGVIRGFHGMPNRLAAMKEHLENNVQLLKNSV